MKMRVMLLTFTVFLALSVPTTYGYSDPISITLIWQFLASILVGIAFFYKNIVLWVQKMFSKNKKDK